MVAQLAFQLKGNQFEGATDEVLTNLLNLSESSVEVGRLNVLVFLTKALEYMYPSPPIRRKIATVFLDEALSEAKEQIGNSNRRDDSDALFGEGLQNLLSVSDENWSAVKVAIQTWFIEGINSNDRSVAIPTTLMIDAFNHRMSSDKSIQRGLSLISEIVDQTMTARLELGKEHVDVALMNFWRAGGGAYQDLIEKHGVVAVLKPVNLLLCAAVSWPVVNSKFYTLCNDLKVQKSTGREQASLTELCNLLCEHAADLSRSTEHARRADYCSSNWAEIKELPADLPARDQFVALAVTLAINGSAIITGPPDLRRILSAIYSGHGLRDADASVSSLDVGPSVSSFVLQILRRHRHG